MGRQASMYTSHCHCAAGPCQLHRAAQQGQHCSPVLVGERCWRGAGAHLGATGAAEKEHYVGAQPAALRSNLRQHCAVSSPLPGCAMWGQGRETEVRTAAMRSALL